jgi:three-Cys-motif partner protein
MDPFRGGGWTQQKVKALRRYLEAYITLMKDKPSHKNPFRKIYFDAFCGSGGRLSSELPLFGGDDLVDITETSPRTALGVIPRFDKYFFCDLKARYVEKLKKSLAAEGFELSNCTFKVGEANAEIKDFCSSIDWRSTRCVMFLDPLGLQVEWKTLETIAQTRAIDLWYLFPSGLGPTRMTPKNGEVPAIWAERLTQIWGDETWMEVAYATDQDQLSLLEANEPRLAKAGNALKFEQAFIVKLKKIFGGVSDSGLRLINSKGSHMFSLLFACANDRPAAFERALRIADHIIEMKER